MGAVLKGSVLIGGPADIARHRSWDSKGHLRRLDSGGGAGQRVEGACVGRIRGRYLQGKGWIHTPSLTLQKERERAHSLKPAPAHPCMCSEAGETSRHRRAPFLATYRSLAANISANICFSSDVKHFSASLKHLLPVAPTHTHTCPLGWVMLLISLHFHPCVLFLFYNRATDTIGW